MAGSGVGEAHRGAQPVLAIRQMNPATLNERPPQLRCRVRVTSAGERVVISQCATRHRSLPRHTITAADGYRRFRPADLGPQRERNREHEVVVLADSGVVASSAPRPKLSVENPSSSSAMAPASCRSAANRSSPV